MMPQTSRSIRTLLTLAVVAFWFLSSGVIAADILELTGVQGGLVVHVGCGDGRLTGALRGGDSFLVLGLDTDPANVATARKLIGEQGQYGPVSVDQFDGKRLPLADNIVNLLVIEDAEQIPSAECMRVLAPGSVLCVRTDGDWHKTIKPRPESIDEWTHFLHDSTGNAVAQDTTVGPPRRTQWVADPRWARSHEHSASLNALVASGGRIFYIIDEGPRASIQLPPSFVLAARDAFSGVMLWKRPLPDWWNHLFPLKSGPTRLTRRLVAIDDEVYTTLGINEPLSAIDAATGKILRTYEQTRTTEELVATEGLLIAVVNPNREPVGYQQESAHCWAERDRASKRWGWDETVDQLVAVDAATGKTVWEKESKIVPLSLAADTRQVVYHDGEAVVAVDLRTGEQRWRTDVPRAPLIPTGWSPSMVMYQDVILFSGMKRSLVALSAEDGKQLWTSKMHPSGHYCPEDVLVVDGLVWSGAIAGARPGCSGVFTGRNPRTGEVEREFAPDVNPFAVMHQRCYPSKATEKYLLPSWLGIEFIDPREETWEIHHWVRGGCFHGIMPCNGLIYATPHACACYYQSKLAGFFALAPAAEEEVIEDNATPRDLVGPAFDRINPSKPSKTDWPTWRHDATRAGYTPAAVPANLTKSWQTTLGGKLGSLVSVDGMLLTTKIDEHEVVALDADSGDTVWTFTAGGRVDSPPTCVNGSVLFGSADGWVYCLRATDGVLAWRHRVAPGIRRIVSRGQLESLWPVHGSILVHEGVAFCLAGRSMFLDGGMRLTRLDAETGQELSETVLDDRVPDTEDNLQTLIQGKKMPVSLPDVLSCDGEYVYMRSQRFDLEGNRVVVHPERDSDQDGAHHVFSPIGMLDDTWFHRGYWAYGKNVGEGWAEWYRAGRAIPTGRILCFDRDRVYAYGRQPTYLCNSSVLEYHLFAANKPGTVAAEPIGLRGEKTPSTPKRVKVSIRNDGTDWIARDKFPLAALSRVDFQWRQDEPPLHVRAMVLADKTLFVAGPPDVEDEKSAWGKHLDPRVTASHREQVASLAGKRGALLWAVSADRGEKLTEYRLDSPPVFDGLIAADGRLYMTTLDGNVLAFAPPKPRP